MKTLVYICGIALCISWTSAAVAFFPNATDPRYPNKCYHNGPPAFTLAIGTKRRTSGESCGVYSCLKDFTLLLIGCGSIGGSEPCRVIPGNPSSPHPHCCPEYIC